MRLIFTILWLILIVSIILVSSIHRVFADLPFYSLECVKETFSGGRMCWIPASSA